MTISFQSQHPRVCDLFILIYVPDDFPCGSSGNRLEPHSSNNRSNQSVQGTLTSEFQQVLESETRVSRSTGPRVWNPCVSLNGKKEESSKRLDLLTQDISLPEKPWARKGKTDMKNKKNENSLEKEQKRQFFSLVVWPQVANDGLLSGRMWCDRHSLGTLLLLIK
jgi:hypothetical protein